MLVSDKARKTDNSWFAETKLDTIPEQTMVEQYKYFDEAKKYLSNSGVITNDTFFRFIYQYLLF